MKSKVKKVDISSLIKLCVNLDQVKSKFFLEKHSLAEENPIWVKRFMNDPNYLNILASNIQCHKPTYKIESKIIKDQAWFQKVFDSFMLEPIYKGPFTASLFH